MVAPATGLPLHRTVPETSPVPPQPARMRGRMHARPEQYRFVMIEGITEVLPRNARRFRDRVAKQPSEESRDQFQSAGMVSAPFGVQANHQVLALMPGASRRTLPSAMHTGMAGWGV